MGKTMILDLINDLTVKLGLIFNKPLAVDFLTTFFNSAKSWAKPAMAVKPCFLPPARVKRQTLMADGVRLAVS